MSKFLYSFIVLMLALGLCACSQAPQQEIDSAKAALEAARALEKYAPEAFQKASDALNTAMAEVEAQNGKFALMRSYSQATELLAKAVEAANQAKAAGEAKREEVKKSAETLIQEAQTALDAAKAAVETAPKGKGSEADIAAMKADLEAQSTALMEAQSAFSAGDYLSAQSKSESVKTMATQISDDIAQAKAKRGRR
jgi:maltodextrin utilization protein YvdJ